jgi:glutamate carboxypeptidase
LNPTETLRHFESKRDDMLAELSELVAMETPSHDVEAISAFVARYRLALESAGLDCVEHTTPRGPCLTGELPGEDPGIVLVGHSDTVWPHGTLDDRPPTLRDGKLFGPGVYDMKAGLCLILAVVRFIAEHRVQLRRRLQVFIATDEETGSISSQPLMDQVLSTDATALVPEPPCPDGSVKIERKGVGIYTIRIKGREAHAGVEPEKGISAIDEVSRLVLELHGWSDSSRGISLNVGRIEGGSASNVVAGEAKVVLDVRFERPEDGEDLHTRVLALRPSQPDASIDIDGGILFPPLVPTPKSRELAAMTCDIAEELGTRFGVGKSGGGSDGSYLASRGLTVIDGLGIDGSGAHATHEHIVAERISFRAALMTRVVLALDEI